MSIFTKIFGSSDTIKEKNKKFKEFEQKYEGDYEMINNQKAAWLTSRGNHYGDKNKLEQAIADFEEALKLKNDYLPAYLSLAIAWAKKGDDAKSEKIIISAPEEMKLHGEVIGTKKDMLEGL
jgi:tetratricopeptide (TPR) repeat protein